MSLSLGETLLEAFLGTSSERDKGVSIDTDMDSDSVLWLHFVELKMGLQVHFHHESGPSYRLDVVVASMTVFDSSCVGVVVKFQDLAI